MQQTPYRCPECSQTLALSSDMWGLFYLCAGCGWTCEDDDDIPEAKRKPRTPGPFPGTLPDLPTPSRHRRPAASI